MVPRKEGVRGKSLEHEALQCIVYETQLMSDSIGGSMRYLLLVLCFVCSLVSVSQAQPTAPGSIAIELLDKIPAATSEKKEVPNLNATGPWNGKAAAIALSYDDGLNTHLDNVVPLLNQHNIRATFYVTGTSHSVVTRSADWKRLADLGHELGNHTMVHPCMGSKPGREWVKSDRDLDSYTRAQFANEVAQANTLLSALDNKTRRTFAYTCGDKEAGGESIVDIIQNTAVAARGVYRGYNVPGKIDLYDLVAYSVNSHDAETLKAQVVKGIENNGLVVFVFHGVGGTHDLDVSQSVHQELIEYLAEQQASLWVAPVIEIADYIVENGLNKQ